MNDGKQARQIIGIIGIILCITLFLWIYVNLFGSINVSNLDYYDELAEWESNLPKLAEINNSENIDFYYYKKNMLIFTSEAYTLTVQYDRATYEMEKELLNEKYVFKSSPSKDEIDRSDGNAIDIYNFWLDSFFFRMLDLDEDEYMYPKTLIFVGTSDKSSEIVYIYYHDSDLDYINSGFDVFIKEECGW